MSLIISLLLMLEGRLFNIIASDVPGGNRILIIKIKAQHSALSKAIKNTEFK